VDKKARRGGLTDRRVLGAYPAQHGVHPRRHLFLPLLQHMSVRIRSQHDRAVAEEVLHILERESLGEEECRRSMAEVIGAQRSGGRVQPSSRTDPNQPTRCFPR
jgi:hypothetical protein